MKTPQGIRSLIDRVSDKYGKPTPPADFLKTSPRPLALEILEPRILFSGSPAPAPEPAPEPAADSQEAPGPAAEESAPASEENTSNVAAPPQGEGSEEENGTAHGQEVTAVSLTQDEVAALADAAAQRWADAGLTEDQRAALAGASYRIADLSGSRIGSAEGNVITIDLDAAGLGWFVDPTPDADEEFSANGVALDAGGAAGRIDLLTVILHEQGHILGLEHDPGSDLMLEILGEGARRLPSAGGAAGSEPHSHGGVEYLSAATDNAISVSEDGPAATGNVITDDDGSGVDSAPSQVIAVDGASGDVGNQITLASGALVTVGADGSYSYDPNGQFESLGAGDTATDSFTYTITDGIITHFDEPALDSRVKLDIPNAGVANITFDAANDELDFTANGTTNMWATRDNAPIAWVDRPAVVTGESWIIETEVRINDISQNQQQAGITFYGGPDGAKPDFIFGLDNWDTANRHVHLQGLQDNNPNVASAPLLIPPPLAGNSDSVFLRVVVTEISGADTYNFFYKEEAADPWTQMGGAAVNFQSNFANSRAGLFYKTGGAKAGAAFSHLSTVNGVPVPDVVATSFDEATLDSNIGLDVPNPLVAGIAFDAANDELDFSATGNTDMWTARQDAPIAWIDRPVVQPGETWAVETEVRLNNYGQANQQAGITFYANADGSKPDFILGLDNWNPANRHVHFQGLGDNNPNVASPTLTADSVFLRVEVTETGSTDLYNFFYKVDAGDPWTQLGGTATNYKSGFDNARAGLFYKTGGARDGAAFNEFNVFTVEDTSTATVDVTINGVDDGLTASIDGSGNLVIEDADGGNEDNLVSISSDGANYSVIIDGNPAETFAVGSVTGDIIVNTGGGDDTLTLDLTTVFADQVFYNGGAQNSTNPGDQLVLTGGGTFDTVEHFFDNPNDGSVEITGNSLITYTGLEPIDDNLDANNRVFSFTSAAAETITLGAGAILDNRIDSTQGESVEFNNPNVSLTINTEAMGGAGADTVSIDGVDSGFGASVAVNAGADDTMNLNADLTLAGGSDGNVNVTSGTINLRGNIDTTAGAAGDVVLDGAVFLGAEITGGVELNFEAANHDGTNQWKSDVNDAGNKRFTFADGATATTSAGTPSNVPGITEWFAFPEGSVQFDSDSFGDAFGNATTQSDATFELWIRPSDFTGTHNIFDTGGNGDGTVIQLIGNQLVAKFQDADSATQRVELFHTFDAVNDVDKFHQIVLTMAVSGTAGANEGKLYVDGNLVDTQSATGVLADWDGNDTSNLGSGGSNVPGGDPGGRTDFSGDIAIFRFYESQLLSASDVADNFASVAAKDITIDAAGDVTFTDTVDSASAANPAALTVNTSGTTTFGADVGTTNALTALTTDSGGTTVFATTEVSDLSAGLEVYLPLDVIGAPGAGQTPDNSGNGRDGAVNGDTVIVGGVVADAADFDANGDFIQLTGYKGVLSGPRTMAAWVKMDASGTNSNDGGIMSWGPNTAAEKWVFRTVNGRLRVETANGGVESSGATINDGTWHHVAAVFSDATANHNDISFYIDGVLQGITNNSGAAVNTTAGSDVYIGTDRSTSNNNSRDFPGAIDDAAIWSRALSDSEVAALAQRSIAVNTTGDQTYNDAVEGRGDITFDGGNVTFASTLDSLTANDLATVAVNTGGTATFGDGVGLGTALESLMTDAAGGTVFEAVTPSVVVPGATQNMDAGAGSAGSWPGLTAPVPVDDPGATGITQAHDFPASAATSGAFASKGVDATFEIWFQPEPSAVAPSGLQVLWEAGGDVNGSVIYIDYDTDEIVFQSQTASGNEVRATAPLGEISGRLRHFVGTIDTSTNVISAFLDGQPFGTAVKANGNWAGGDAAGLGQMGGGSISGLGVGQVFANFEGKISSFRYYENQILDAEQIVGNYLALAPATVITRGDQTYQQGVTILDDARFVGDNVFFNDVGMGSNDLTVEVGGAAGTFAGEISGSGDVTKNGAGTMTITGANTYSSLTRVAEGTLVVAGPANNDSAIRGDIQINNFGTLQVNSNNRIINNSDVTVDTGGTFDLNGANDAVGNLNGAGSVTLGGGTLTLDDLNGNEFSGVISEGGGITLRGNTTQGTQILSGDNTYTGTTLIETGNTLQIGNGGTSGEIGTGTVNIFGGTLVLNTTDGVNHSADLNLTDGVLRAQDGNNTFSGDATGNMDIQGTSTFTVDAGAVLTIDNNGGDDNIGFSGNPTLILDGAGDGRINRDIARGDADGTVVKNGTGTWTLAGALLANEGWSTGGLLINEGTLATGAANVVPYGGSGADSKGNVVIAAGATLNLDGGGLNLNGIEGMGTVEITGATNRNLIVGHENTTATFSGTVQDTGGGNLNLQKVGNGDHTFDGVVDYDGTTLVNGNGTLRLAPATGGLELNGAVDVEDSSTLELAPVAGDLVINGAVRVIASAFLDASSPGGNISLTNTLTLGDNNAADFDPGAGSTATFGALVDLNDNSTLTLESGGSTIGALNVNSAGGDTGTVQVDAGATVDITGNIGMAATTLVLDGAGTGTVSGTLALGNAAGTLVKNGTGTWIFSGTGNNMTGAYEVNAGTLQIDGELGVNATAFNVYSGATGTGDGTINAPVTVDAGGTFSPGVGGPGDIETEDLTLAAGATYAVDIDGTTAATEYDQTVVTGTADVSGAILALDLGSFLAENGDEFVLIDTTGGVTGEFDGFAEGAPVFVGGQAFSITYMGGTDGMDVVLTSVGETGVTLNGDGDLVVDDINDGGITDDRLFVTVVQDSLGRDALQISDPNQVLTTNIVGAERPDANTVVVAFILFDDLIITTREGQDVIRFDDLTGFDQSITVDGGGTDGAVDFIDFRASAVGDVGESYDFDAEKIHFYLDSSISATGGGTIDITSADGGAEDFVGLQLRRASLSSEDGAITLVGEGGSVGNNNDGVLLSMGSSITTTGGSVSITGTATSAAGPNDGVSLVGGSDITVGGAGTITITGTSNGASDSYGVQLFTGTELTSAEGDISLAGGGNGTGARNSGIYTNGATVTTTGAGSISLDGEGSGGGTNSKGLRLTGSTLEAAGTGGITLTGTGGGGTSSNVGVEVGVRTSVTTASGDVTITGEGAGSATRNAGVSFLSRSSVDSGGGITVTGTGGDGTSHNDGVSLVSATLDAGGDISVTGVGAGSGNYNRGIDSTRSSFGGGEVTLTGTGTQNGGGSARFGDGVYLNRGGATAAGTLTIGATGGTGSSNNRGLYASGVTLGGTLAVTGTADAGTTGSGNAGVFIQNSTLSDDGTIAGTGGGGTGPNFGVYMQNITGGAGLDVSSGPLDDDDEKGGNYFNILPALLLAAGADRRSRARKMEKTLRSLFSRIHQYLDSNANDGATHILRTTDKHLLLDSHLASKQAVEAAFGLAGADSITTPEGTRRIVVIEGDDDEVLSGTIAFINESAATLHSYLPIENRTGISVGEILSELKSGNESGSEAEPSRQWSLRPNAPSPTLNSASRELAASFGIE